VSDHILLHCASAQHLAFHLLLLSSVQCLLLVRTSILLTALGGWYSPSDCPHCSTVAGSLLPLPLPALTMSGMSDRDAFAMFDADGDGAINALELSHALYAMGCNPTVKECEAYAAQCPDSTRIDFATFGQILKQAPRPDSSAAQHLLEAFRVFDKNEDGKIPENDLRQWTGPLSTAALLMAEAVELPLSVLLTLFPLSAVCVAACL